MEVAGKMIEGGQNIFFAQLADPSTTHFSADACRYFSGEFIFMIFGLPGAAAMQLTDRNALFSLLEGEDKAVLVHIWMEGTDPACTDELRASDYSISLRFTGETTEQSTETKSG